VAKPFLKWAGGKGQLLPRFGELYPAELKLGRIENYYEPFVGGGADFFDIARRFSINTAYLSDANEALILTYNAIKNDTEKLLTILSEYQKKYDRYDSEKRQKLYYEERELFNMKASEKTAQAARMIFLNKTCFNGLFRVNSKGGFNAPIGDYKSPTICDEKNLIDVAKLLQNAEIKNADFESVENDIKANAFVYFDPPYRPIGKSANFNAYHKGGFDDEEQRRLANLFKRLDKKGAKLALSNSDPKNTNPNDCFFDDLYKGFNIQRIPAARRINSNAAKRGSISEIVVMNYERF
jgi:DNA adenine methylase